MSIPKNYFPKVDLSSHEFVTPNTIIKTKEDVNLWLKSQAATHVLDYIQLLSLSVKSKTLRSSLNVSPIAQKMLDMLDILEIWIDEIPPLTQQQRFGNKAFRTFYERLKQNGVKLMNDILEEPFQKASSELSVYLIESFGNQTRIDYGTGHELSFVCWMCCFELIGATNSEDYPALVLRVFDKYLKVVRKLQRTYMLEPAGSHGVWGLDDHQFISFIWGSSQFIDHPQLTPKSILNKTLAEDLSNDYMFMACIKYINEVKKGPFHEHSPLLYDISAVPLWTKVNTGLHKMYVAEVLNKFPIVQHFLFGSLLTMKPSPNQNELLKI